MIPLLMGVGSYLLAGTLSLVLPKLRFSLSLLGLLGGILGVGRASMLYSGASGSITRYLGQWGALGIETTIDITTLLFAALIVILNLFTLLYFKGTKNATFYSLYNLVLAISFSLAFSSDLFNLYVSLELISLLSILLIGYDRKGYQIYAGIKYLLLSSFSMSLYLLGLSLIYHQAGHLGITRLAETVGKSTSLGISVGISLMIGGLAVKGGVILFSMWLPDAHSYSGTVVSVLLSGMAIKCGLIGIIRLSSLSSWNPVLLGLGAITGIGGAAYAIFENRPKKILAYSTMSQIGYILLGVGTGTYLGVTAASMYILFHGLFKGLLFLSVGHAGLGGTNLYENEEIPVPLGSKIGLLVGSLSIMAVPPFNGYFSKSLLLEQAPSDPIRYLILLISLGTAIYFVKLNWAILYKHPTGKLSQGGTSIILFAAAVATTSLVTAAVVGGQKVLKLLHPHHAVESLAIVAAAVGLYALSHTPIEKLTAPTHFFKLENTLISFLTAFLVLAGAFIFL